MVDGIRPDWSGRLDRVRTLLRERQLDALLVSSPVNIRYLSGFTGSSGLLLLSGDATWLVTDGRYLQAVREAQGAGSLADIGLEPVTRRYDITATELIERAGLRQVGFEAAHVTVSTLESWRRRAPAIEWVPTERLVESLRLIKDAYEIAALRRGGMLIGEVVAQLPEIVRRDRSEREIARAIDAALISAGFSESAFSTIVASGPNSALPHARPSDRRLTSGDLVVLDFGGVLDGYCVDLTRMAAVGPPSSEASRVVAAVAAAHRSAIDAVRPGADTATVDEAAREVLESHGLGGAFVHATGHGLGLDVHEAPRIGRRDEELTETVRPGMVFTIEPGAYLDGLLGVRLEDDVLVTPDGCDVLTDAPRELLVV